MNPPLKINDSLENFYFLRQNLNADTSDSSLPASIRYPLIVSLDVEFNERCITQLGASILDWNIVESSLPTQSISNEFPIMTALYRPRRVYARIRKRKRSYFGKLRRINLSDLEHVLHEILTPVDEQGNARDVILVGHNISSDIHEIEKSCGLKLTHDFPSVKAIIDTMIVSQRLLDRSEALSLKRLLVAFRLDHDVLHNTAYDSRHTLRALLSMLCFSARQLHSSGQLVSCAVDQRLELIEEIAKFHKPYERTVWCYNSKRVKIDGYSDLFDCEEGDQDICEKGLLAGILEPTFA